MLTLLAAAVEIGVAVGVMDVFGRAALDAHWFPDLELALGALLPALVLFLVVPLIRRDRATIGQICTWLANAGADGKPVGRRAVVSRFATRWLVWMGIVLVAPAYAFPAILAYEVATVLARRDRSSLSGMISGTWTATRRSLR